MSKSDRAWGRQGGLQGVTVEFEGVIADVRERMAASISQALPDHAKALTHGFFCRHLHFPLFDTVAESVAKELELRAPAREKLRAALSSIPETMDAKNGDVLRPGITGFFAAAARAGLKVSVVGGWKEEAITRILSECGADKVEPMVLSWSVGNENAFLDGWASVVRKVELPAGACMAVVGSGDSRYGALAAGFRCIGVPDKYTGHHDFSGTDGVFTSLGEVDLLEMSKTETV